MAVEYGTRSALVLTDYFDRWLLQVNPNKTQVLTVTKKRPSRPDKVSVKGQIVEVSTLTLLGMLIDTKLNYIAAANDKRSAAFRAYWSLSCLTGPKSQLSSQTKIFLYETTLRPIPTHGCEIWSHYITDTQWKRIEKIQRVPKAARGKSKFASTREIMELTGLPTVREFCLLQRKNLFVGSSRHP